MSTGFSPKFMAHRILDCLSQGRISVGCAMLTAIDREELEALHEEVQGWEQSQHDGPQRILLLAIRGLLAAH